jgi:hypothetical protein
MRNIEAAEGGDYRAAAIGGNGGGERAICRVGGGADQHVVEEWLGGRVAET